MDALSQRRIGDIGELPQLALEVMQLQRTDGVDCARSQPRVPAREQRRDRLFGGLERCADEPIGQPDPLVDGDLAVEQRHQQTPKSGLSTLSRNSRALARTVGLVDRTPT